MARITLGVPNVSREAKRLVNDVLNSGQLSPGPKVRSFESKFAKLHGCRHGMMVNSGTDALRIALATLKEVHKWPDGAKVLVPSITFVATANVVIQNNLVPEFVDVGMYDYNLNPEMLERILAPQPKGNNPYKAIIVAHLFGQPADMVSIMRIAWKYKLKVIEDSCETMLAKVRGLPVGCWGDIACFSTYMAHLLTTGVGGIATTNNEKYDEVMRSYLNHGRDPSYLPGYRCPPLTKDLLSKRFRFVRIGYSSRATEMEAALGLAQLKELPKMIQFRQSVASRLTKGLERFAPLALPEISPGREHVFMMYPIVIREYSKIKKEDLVWHLEQRGVETRDMLPLLSQPCYKKLVDGSLMGYSVAKWINEKGFYIPCHHAMTTKEINRIVKAFKDFL